MSVLTREQLAEIKDVLGFANPAAPELVVDAIRATTRVVHRVADVDARRALLAVPPLARRLLDAETERTTFRTTIARLVIATNHGDDRTLGDLAWELERAGIDLKREYAEADALAEATAREGWTL
ncbi:hypothetical protein [Streptomyces chartreusis]|uniref:hypothetical protein n=1 Tax=Streptomyces chartreusis TaxID=1969 RepID=UPI003438D231